MPRNAIESNAFRLDRAADNADLLYRWLSTRTVENAPAPPAPKQRVRIAPTETADSTFDAVADAEAQLDAICRRLDAVHGTVAAAAYFRNLDPPPSPGIPCWTHPEWTARLGGRMRATLRSAAALHAFYSEEYRRLSSADDGGEWVHGAAEAVVELDAELERLVRSYVPPAEPPKRDGCRPPWCTGEVVYPGVSGGLCRTHYMQHYRRRRRRKARRAA